MPAAETPMKMAKTGSRVLEKERLAGWGGRGQGGLGWYLDIR